MQRTEIQITVLVLLDSVQMQASKQRLKHFHMPRTDFNCLQLFLDLEIFEYLDFLKESERKAIPSGKAQTKIPHQKKKNCYYILL